MDQNNNQGQFNQGAPFQQQPQQWQQQQAPQQWQQQEQLSGPSLDSIGAAKEEYVQLTNGQQVVIPRLDMFKVIRLAKTLAKDIVTIYGKWNAFVAQKQAQNPNADANKPLISMDEIAEFIITELQEQQIGNIIGIITGIDEKDVLKTDFVDIMLVLEKFADVNDIEKSFKSVRGLIKKFAPNLPIPEANNQQ